MSLNTYQGFPKCGVETVTDLKILHDVFYKRYKVICVIDEDKWITTKGGHRVLIGENGEIKAGMGGKFNGENISGISNVTSVAEKQKKIDSVKIDFSKDNILPGLNKEDLAELGKEDKPVVLKKGVIDRNIQQHPDISKEEFTKLLSKTLYDPSFILQEKSKLGKSSYHHFVKYLERDNSIVLVELSAEKANYEVVHVQKMRNRSLERLKNKNK